MTYYLLNEMGIIRGTRDWAARKTLDFMLKTMVASAPPATASAAVTAKHFSETEHGGGTRVVGGISDMVSDDVDAKYVMGYRVPRVIKDQIIEKAKEENVPVQTYEMDMLTLAGCVGAEAFYWLTGGFSKTLSKFSQGTKRIATGAYVTVVGKLMDHLVEPAQEHLGNYGAQFADNLSDSVDKGGYYLIATGGVLYMVRLANKIAKR